MRLGFLGTGTAIPSATRGASGYVLEAEGDVLLLECGPGSTRRWPAMGLDFARIGAVLCSHHHVDHCGDLAALLFGRNVAPEVHEGLVLAGPTGHGRLIDRLQEAFGDGVRHDDLQVVELDEGGALALAGFAIEARAMAHPRRNADEAPALGFRIERGGRRLAFSGDSGACDALVELCRGVDLALLECSYPAGRESSRHLNAATVAQVARDAGVRRLVLTHIYPEADRVDLESEVRAAGYEGELTIASDGLWLGVE
ncbi:MAG: MBL fold metallo-hydrolase [Deltaproteobacteria bacterium]|nr:MBL fold metallo-hydrolase [Deltaproteobacteria bacterium]